MMFSKSNPRKFSATLRFKITWYDRQSPKRFHEMESVPRCLNRRDLPEHVHNQSVLQHETMMSTQKIMMNEADRVIGCGGARVIVDTVD